MQSKLTQPVFGGSKRRKLFNQLSSLAIVVVIFFLGTAVGDGQIKSVLHIGNKPITGLPSKLDMSSVEQVYKSIKDNYDGKLTASQLIDGLKHGLATATNDPYTTYFTPAEASTFIKELNNSFSGIGAQLGTDADGNVEVISPISGLPADKAGLKAQDLIASINSVTTAGMSVDQAVSKIRGPKGTTVTLQIVRKKAQSLSFTITRDDITLPSVKTKILDGNVGYVQISTFADDTTSLMQKAADDFKAKNVSGIILDLRNNPGGLLDAAVKVSSLWLEPSQTVLQEKRGTEVVQTYQALGGNELHRIPTVILIDAGSASASEITTGALHDNKLAYVIGEKSYGKGVVQQLVNFTDGSQLKVTVASWYRPNGQNINKLGISPDATVTISAADAAAGTDTQLLAAQAYLKK
jgi:carboxyl-terminal processing protease